MRLAACLLIGWTLTAATGPAAAQSTYATIEGESCGGYPRIDIAMIEGVCAGLVVQSPGGRGNMRLPRTMVQIPGSADWLIADLGGWNVKAGAVWRMSAKPGEPVKLNRLFVGLDMPHTILIGPDGRVYVGEMGRIFSFDPKASVPRTTVVDVVTDLPTNRLHDNRHPLSAFIFAPDGALFVNVGAASDQCLDEVGAPLGERCAEGEGEDAGAVVRRYARLADGTWSKDYTILASGLRNSMAFAFTQKGQLLQAENSIDIADTDRPLDEINLLQQGKHYGWPYCMDKATPTPGWKSTRVMDCKSAAHTPPVAMLGSHAAPLGMTWYTGAMFPELRGRLLVTQHGYQGAGASIVSFGANGDGVPTGKPQAFTKDWTDKVGIRPRGSPVGISVASDGAIWVADDRSRAIIRFARDQR